MPSNIQPTSANQLDLFSPIAQKPKAPESTQKTAQGAAKKAEPESQNSRPAESAVLIEASPVADASGATAADQESEREAQRRELASSKSIPEPSADVKTPRFGAWIGPQGQEAAYAALPIPPSPSALMLASRKQDYEMGASLLDTFVRWDLNELDPTRPKEAPRADALPAAQASTLVNWLLASPPQAHRGYYHSTIDDAEGRQRIAIEMMRRGANVWQETPRGSAMAKAVFAQNTSFFLAAVDDPQWSLGLAQATRVHEPSPPGKTREASLIRGQDMLTWAAQTGNEKIVEALLKAGWSPDRLDHDGAPPLAKCKEAKIVQLLLDAGGDPEIKDREGEFAMTRLQQNAASTIERDNIGRLIGDAQLKRIEGKKNTPEAQAQMERLRDMNRKALFAAAQGQPQSSFQLLAGKFKFKVAQERDEQGRTLAMAALQGGRYSTALNLLKAGSDASAVDNKGRSLLAYWAISSSASSTGAAKPDFTDRMRAHKLASVKDAAGLGPVPQAMAVLKEALAAGEMGQPHFSDMLDALDSLQSAGADLMAKERDGRQAIAFWLDELQKVEIHGYQAGQLDEKAKLWLPGMDQETKNGMAKYALKIAIGNLSGSYQAKACELFARIAQAGGVCSPPSAEEFAQDKRARAQSTAPAFLAAVEKLELAQIMAQQSETAPGAAPSAGKKGPAAKRL